LSEKIRCSGKIRGNFPDACFHRQNHSGKSMNSAKEIEEKNTKTDRADVH